MSSPIAKYQEMFLDLQHRLESIDYKKESLSKFNFGPMNMISGKIKRMNAKILYPSVFILIFLILYIIKPKFVKKEDKIKMSKVILYTFIISLPVIIYIVIRKV
jgi:hypothetical protein